MDGEVSNMLGSEMAEWCESNPPILEKVRQTRSNRIAHGKGLRVDKKHDHDNISKMNQHKLALAANKINGNFIIPFAKVKKGLILAAAILVLYLLGTSTSASAAAASIPAPSSGEGFRACTDCDSYGMQNYGRYVVNPFIWPYSGTGCGDGISISSRDEGIQYGEDGTLHGEDIHVPMTHLSTPDHVLFTR